jgi:hypothetical protein
MGYYVRAFCTGQQVPQLATIQHWLRKHGSAAVLDDPNHAVEMTHAGGSGGPILDLHTSDWEQVAVAYKSGKLPILVECNRDDGTHESLLHQEISEFVDLIANADPIAAGETVLRHLEATRFIVACQLPTSDIDDDGYEANGRFLAFFVERCGGIIQADGEGFYQGGDLILPLEP